MLSKKPIEIFSSKEQFEKCCKWWQHALFLDNWFISYELTEDVIQEDGQLMWGYCTYSFGNSSACICVYNGRTSEYGDKNIAELTLAHELLHLKLEYMTDEEVVGELPMAMKSLIHQQTEAMAKSLIIAKYGVEYDYFMNNTVFKTKAEKVNP